MSIILIYFFNFFVKIRRIFLVQNFQKKSPANCKARYSDFCSFSVSSIMLFSF